MTTSRRYLSQQIEADLARKMLFIAGPRQVGKTTLGLSQPNADSGYLNWDIPEHREKILRNELPPSPLWFFDEIHKYRSWRNYLKGVYDGKPPGQQILVTGSARLDLYRYSGDSLQGRYHLLRMHPLSIAELGLKTASVFQQLLTLGGFPEPFFSGSEVEARRWSREYRNLLVREDITTLERVQDLGNLERLMLRLPDLVGSPLSLNALREDLQVSHKTISNWVSILEKLYALFRLSPFGGPKIRAIKKSQKHYHMDWSLVADQGPKFENMVACHLLKWVHFQQDTQGHDIDLHYFRDTDGREVDFVISDRGKPVTAIECKWSDSRVDKNLRYWKARFPDCEAWQLSATGTKDFITPDGIRVCHALNYLNRLV
ncbi:MAG: ATP-binding protein [Gammaproteobacteria bacterium]|nr:ATP-binding protein [Gammaproteobacteria bacterium]